MKTPATLAAGRYTLLACADPAKKVRESKETNNCRAASAKLTVTRAGARPPGPRAVPAPVPVPQPGAADAGGDRHPGADRDVDAGGRRAADHLRPDRHGRLRRGDVHLHRRRPVRVPPRRRPMGAVHVADDLHEPARRRAHVRRPLRARQRPAATGRPPSRRPRPARPTRPPPIRRPPRPRPRPARRR